MHQIGERLNLEVRCQVHVGRRIWGSERKIDILLRDRKTGKRLGIECKYQKSGGSAEEKIPAIIQDIEAWPIDGLVVVHGEGFKENMKSFLLSTGKAVYLEDLEVWLKLFFDLDLSE